MRKILVMAALAVALAPRGAGAQQQPATAASAVYVELLGNGLLYSVNYDHRVTPHLSARVGFMGLGAADETVRGGVVAAPVMLNYLFGEGSSHFEVGVGLMFSAGAIDQVEPAKQESFRGAVGTGTLGYRYQRPQGGMIFRAGLTPFFNASGFAPSVGVSVGYGF